MSLESFILIFSIVWSLILLGPRRTALWLVPGILFLQSSQLYWLITGSIFLSGLCSSILFVPYRETTFDFREIKKERWIVILFLSGVLTGSLLYPSSLFIFGLGALGPLMFWKLCLWFRWPLQYVYAFPPLVRWLILLSYSFLIAIKFKREIISIF